ncbi:Ribosomal RNA methyltransferase MRM2, mitochondrial [Cladophialophora carrionii]|uniref:rRNA methyltransferase 2, mitochondrial n=1 Tax=Cladophialophora carrionii TaxID=86049 RepID=A0A1C1CCP4_9EURO|nr:Ribosomal RNA methyltransferase MRM2, mitochondrial [Cladophialophora carrionii]
MSPLAKLYLISCWSYIISFHLTLSILTLDMSASFPGDHFARAAKVQGLKSRAAFKLLQINERYRLFRPGMTVVDLGFAPGSWSQVAIDLTKPRGRVLGVDLLPVQPPKGVSTIQGDFLSPDIQAEIKAFLRDPDRGRLRRPFLLDTSSSSSSSSSSHHSESIDQATLEEEATGYLERESHVEKTLLVDEEPDADADAEHSHADKCADVVLSDMCEPWDPLDGLYKKSISNPYHRLMNTSGNAFRDHAGSMDLCRGALRFSYDTLKVGGHFVCKFYQGVEDKALERSLKAMFHKVHREKPESSRAQSKEAYFVGIKRLAKVDRDLVFAEP